MIQELIFTSAPRGLQVGRSGFCTVASTPGMAENVARLLESLSGYRHVFPPGSTGAQTNPVAYSHLITKIGGRELHIISRVADAGLDYSGRSNKIAHHIAFDRSEMPPGGPASIIAAKPFIEKWEGEPRHLPPRKLPTAPNPPRVCTTWAQVTGDAGWAGALAEALLNQHPTVVVINSTTPAFELVAELSALLPNFKQNELTFNTCHLASNTVGTFDCKFVLENSAEASIALRNQKNTIFDCTRAIGPSTTPLGVFARHGHAITSNDLAKLGTSIVGVGHDCKVLPSMVEVEVAESPEYKIAKLPPRVSAERLGSVNDILEVQIDYGAKQVGFPSVRWIFGGIAVTALVASLVCVALVFVTRFPNSHLKANSSIETSESGTVPQSVESDFQPANETIGKHPPSDSVPAIVIDPPTGQGSLKLPFSELPTDRMPIANTSDLSSTPTAHEDSLSTQIPPAEDSTTTPDGDSKEFLETSKNHAEANSPKSIDLRLSDCFGYSIPLMPAGYEEYLDFIGKGTRTFVILSNPDQIFPEFELLELNAIPLTPDAFVTVSKIDSERKWDIDYKSHKIGSLVYDSNGAMQLNLTDAREWVVDWQTGFSHTLNCVFRLSVNDGSSMGKNEVFFSLQSNGSNPEWREVNLPQLIKIQLNKTTTFTPLDLDASFEIGLDLCSQFEPPVYKSKSDSLFEMQSTLFRDQQEKSLTVVLRCKLTKNDPYAVKLHLDLGPLEPLPNNHDYSTIIRDAHSAIVNSPSLAKTFRDELTSTEVKDRLDNLHNQIVSAAKQMPSNVPESDPSFEAVLRDLAKSPEWLNKFLEVFELPVKMDLMSSLRQKEELLRIELACLQVLRPRDKDSKPIKSGSGFEEAIDSRRSVCAKIQAASKDAAIFKTEVKNVEKATFIPVSEYDATGAHVGLVVFCLEQPDEVPESIKPHWSRIYQRSVSRHFNK